jgi:hypothetical protein
VTVHGGDTRGDTGSGTRRGGLALRAGQAVVVVVVAGALGVQLWLSVRGGAGADGATAGVRLGRLFSYFTIQSNLFVLGTALVLVLRPGFDGPVWRVLRLDALLGITITGLVYAIVLAPEQHLTGWAEAANIGFHYASPWATVLLWLLFGPRPRITWPVAGWAFVWPAAWLVYIFAQGAVTRWYPYPFLDAGVLGLGPAVRNSAVVLVVALVLAALLVYADTRLPVLGARRVPVARTAGEV